MADIPSQARQVLCLRQVSRVHLTRKGYTIWAEAMLPKLKEMLN